MRRFLEFKFSYIFHFSLTSLLVLGLRLLTETHASIQTSSCHFLQMIIKIQEVFVVLGMETKMMISHQKLGKSYRVDGLRRLEPEWTILLKVIGVFLRDFRSLNLFLVVFVLPIFSCVF